MSTVLNISAACAVSVFWSRVRPKSSHCPKPEDRVAPFQITFYSADIVAFFPLCPVGRPPSDIFLFSRYGRIFCQYRRGGPHSAIFLIATLLFLPLVRPSVSLCITSPPDKVAAGFCHHPVYFSNFETS